jgi:hypothetical protein
MRGRRYAYDGTMALEFTSSGATIELANRVATLMISPTEILLDDRGALTDISRHPALHMGALVGDATFGSQIVRHAIGAVLHLPYADALELWVLHSAPLLRHLMPRDARPIGITSERLHRALQETSALAAARVFWDDVRTTRSDTPAFSATLAFGTTVDSSRTGLIGLAAPGMRHTLIQAPHTECLRVAPEAARVLDGLTDRIRTEMIRYGLTIRGAGRILGSALEAGLRLTPGEPPTSWQRLEEQLLAGGYFATSSVARRVVSTGIGGMQVHQLTSARQCARAGDQFSNCLGTRAHGWPSRVALGTHLVFTVHDLDGGPVAAFAIDKQTGQVVQQSGPGNRALPDDLRHEIDAVVQAAVNPPTRDRPT